MKPAGFWIRFAASILDLAFWNLALYPFEQGLSAVFGLSPLGQQILGFGLEVICLYLYYVEVPLRWETTPGKRLFGICVVDRRTGLLFSRKQAVKRFLGYLPSYALIGCGFLMVLFHPQKIALHDWIAGTVAIRKRKGTPDLSRG
ncbi:RDD family protein [bacterium]|jgi:uncharacterized RDD family membrane protein YckC|nr:RDD family protein [bacterium]